MIEIAERVEVAASPEAVWAVLSDPADVVSCVPGAELVSLEGTAFEAKITVKFGPMRIAFGGRGALELDDETHSGSLSGQGRDGRGATKARASATFTVVPAADGVSTVIDIRGEVVLSGPLAGVVERGASVVIGNLSGDFATALAERCARGPRAEGAAPGAVSPARVSFRKPASDSSAPRSESS